MAVNLPNPPPASSPSDFNSPGWQNWFARLAEKVRAAAQILWTQIDFTGSNLTSIATRNHNDLQNIQGGTAGDYQHLTTAQKALIGPISNNITTAITVGTDTSFMIISYLNITSDLTINGNLMVAG